MSDQCVLFYGPCLPCVSWWRSSANIKVNREDRIANIVALKNCFRQIFNMNKEKVECRDPVMLYVLNV